MFNYCDYKRQRSCEGFIWKRIIYIQNKARFLQFVILFFFLQKKKKRDFCHFTYIYGDDTAHMSKHMYV